MVKMLSAIAPPDAADAISQIEEELSSGRRRRVGKKIVRTGRSD